MLAKDIAALIVSDGYGSTGALFEGGYPPEPDACVAVTEYPGTAGVAFFGEAAPGVERPRVQVKVRGNPYDQDGPRLVIERIYQALSARGAFVVNNCRYLDLTAIAAPFPLGRDENNRWEFAVNFDVHKSLSPTATSTST